VNLAAHCEPSCPTNVRARRELSRAPRTFPRAANFLCAANVFCTPRTFPRTFATRREPSCAPRTFPCAARVAPRACPRLGELRTRHELPTRLAHFCTRRELFYAVNFAAHCEPSAPRTFVCRELAAFACAPRTLPTWRGISAANVPVWSELRLAWPTFTRAAHFPVRRGAARGASQVRTLSARIYSLQSGRDSALTSAPHSPSTVSPHRVRPVHKCKARPARPSSLNGTEQVRREGTARRGVQGR